MKFQEINHQMTSVRISFIYNGESYEILAKTEEYMKDIFKRFLSKLNKNIENPYYLYDGTAINEELKLGEISKNNTEIGILVGSNEPDEPEGIKYSKDIICPECGENCIIMFNDYKIDISNCKNNHSFNYILFDKFKETQKIDESKIICNDCKNVNKLNSSENKFYQCCACSKSICPICQYKNHKDHITIDYDSKKYFCNLHGEKYNLYCKDCNMNLCDICNHDESHEIILLKTLMKDKKEILEINEKLKEKIDLLKNEINEIIERFKKVLNELELYYDITNNTIKNFDIKYKNYQSLTNMININESDIKIINNIYQVINENLIENKIKFINNIYQNFITKNNEIIIEYKVEAKDEKLKIFGEDFVKINKLNYEMLINNKKYELNSYLNIKDFEIKNNKIEIKLKEINNVTNLYKMFYNCSSLLSLKNISKFNINNITNLSVMFDGCSSLESLPDISKWNTDKVTDISFMFNKCSSLKSLPDISKWNTNNINNMRCLFQGCSSLKSLPDISKWNTENVSDLGLLFNKCSSLKSLPDISNWNIDKISDMSAMFSECSSLISLPDISKWNTKNVKIMKYLFYDCSSLKSLPNISKWNTENVTDMSYMFNKCKNLISLPDFTKMNLSNLINDEKMFDGCTSLKNKPNLYNKSKCSNQ